MSEIVGDTLAAGGSLYLDPDDTLLAELVHARKQAKRCHEDAIRWEGRAEGLATALRESERAAMGASR